MPTRNDHIPHKNRPRLTAGASLVACAAGIGACVLGFAPPGNESSSARVIPVSWVIEPEPEPDQDREQEQGKEESAPDKTDEGIRECVITLKSGRTINGELIRQDSRIVVIGIEGIDTTFQRRNVANIVVLPPVSERYERLRATITDDDIDARLALVEWLRSRKAYKIALKELDEIILLDPLNRHAKLLHKWLSEYDKLSTKENEQQEEHASQEPGTPEQAEGESSGEEEREYHIRRNELPTLSEEQLNLMRVYEIDLRDPPEIRVPDDVMLELMQANPDAFSPNEDERRKVLKLPEIEKLKLLFSLKARDMYARVQVLETPDSLEQFKERVHHGRGWLINACASTRCHGGVDAGSFQLINERPNTDATAFTNLYIIENSTLSDGTPLIDFTTPERSPLLQMGMIPNNALIAHPEIPKGYPGTGYRPIFRHTRDRNYQRAVDWIRSMYQPRPKLDFEYPPIDAEQIQTQPEPDQNAP